MKRKPGPNEFAHLVKEGDTIESWSLLDIERPSTAETISIVNERPPPNQEISEMVLKEGKEAPQKNVFPKRTRK